MIEMAPLVSKQHHNSSKCVLMISMKPSGEESKAQKRSVGGCRSHKKEMHTCKILTCKKYTKAKPETKEIGYLAGVGV